MDGWFWLVNSMHGLIFASYKGDFSVDGFNQGHLLEEENLIKHWTRQVVGVRMRRDTRKTFCTIKLKLVCWIGHHLGGIRNRPMAQVVHTYTVEILTEVVHTYTAEILAAIGQRKAASIFTNPWGLPLTIRALGEGSPLQSSVK